MKRVIYVLAIGVAFLALYRAFAHEYNNVSGGDGIDRVFVGQSVEVATNVLKNRGIKFDEAKFSQVRTDPDISNLYFNLDPNHADACAYYSKSKSTITGIALIFYPSRKQRAKFEPRISAKELVLYQDRSYSVTFSIPITEEELKRAEESAPKNQYPQNSSSK